MNATSLIVGFALADRHGLPRDEAVKFGVIGGLMPPRALSYVVVDQLASKKAEELAPVQTPEVTHVDVPNVLQMPVPAAKQAVSNAGLVADIQPPSAFVVTRQEPPAGGEKVEIGQVVKLTVDAPLQ